MEPDFLSVEQVLEMPGSNHRRATSRRSFWLSPKGKADKAAAVEFFRKHSAAP